MNRAVVVLLLLIANAVVSTRMHQPRGISPASPQDRSRAHSDVVQKGAVPEQRRFADAGTGHVARSQPPAGRPPGCRNPEDARAASWLRL